MVGHLAGSANPDVATDFSGMRRVLAAIVTWVKGDHEEGRKFVDQVVSFGNCIVNMTEAKTASKCADDKEKLMPYGVYGRSYTLNLQKWTPASSSTLAKYSHSGPGKGAMVSVHSLRSPKPNEDSVFGTREDHHMVEIVSMTSDSALEEETAAWRQGLLRKLKDQDGSNVPDSA